MNYPYRLLPSASIAAVVLSLSLNSPVQAGSAVTASDLQTVVQLRTLAQRAAKLSLQIQLGVKEDDAVVQLFNSIKSFDKALESLSRLQQGNEDLQRTLDAVRVNWEDMKMQLANRNPDQIYRSSEEVALSVLRARTVLQDATGAESSKLLTLSEQQNTLSQRMAKLYYLSCLGRATSTEVAVTRQRFRQGLTTLNGAAELTTRSKYQLELAQTQWLFYDQALKDPQQLKLDRNRKIYLENISTTSDRISEVMSVVSSDLTRGKGKKA